MLRQEGWDVMVGEFDYHDVFVPFRVLCLLTKFSRVNNVSCFATYINWRLSDQLTVDHRVSLRIAVRV